MGGVGDGRGQAAPRPAAAEPQPILPLCPCSTSTRPPALSRPPPPPPPQRRSAYLVFDTQLLITRFDLDDYIWAAVTVYLDIINLFLYILRLLGEQRNS